MKKSYCQTRTRDGINLFKYCLTLESLVLWRVCTLIVLDRSHTNIFLQILIVFPVGILHEKKYINTVSLSLFNFAVFVLILVDSIAYRFL